MPSHTVSDGLQRLAAQHRSATAHLQRAPWRYRSKRKGLKLTPTEKLAVVKKKLERREKRASVIADAQQTVSDVIAKAQAELGVQDFQQVKTEIMQDRRKATTKRAPNRWNAFVMSEAKRMNDALPDGAPRLKSSELAGQIRERWLAMSPEERVAATTNTIQELADKREMRRHAPHNTAISAFHDARASITAMQRDLEALHERTGVEAVLMVVRTSPDHYNRPFAFVTSQRAESFFSYTLNTQAIDVALHLESFCLSGVTGLVEKGREWFAQTRMRLQVIILNKLRNVAQANVPKMQYKNFHRQITARYGVVIEGWPLDKFVPPSLVKSRTELEVLLRAWETDATRFRKLSKQEFQLWQENHVREAQSTEDSDDDESEETIDDTALGGGAEPFMQDLVPSTRSDPTESSVQDESPSQAVTQLKSNPRNDTLTNIVNVVMSASGTAVPIVKKPRKTRSDKGKPRKKRPSSTETATITPSPVTVSASPAS
ncbi:hypothetical protein CERSUDRAFT_94917 [Gelatoporia subvermispora B]|uniref:Uncharacterized protein n=1 Tax=Ceriporiopsis subvermispora (strain B) TaxID=914234 RepID=M2PNE8_CERS8|nr:hypothetical protein CERSUDRAFT_94917 [Gelatoporia subvermispora B]